MSLLDMFYQNVMKSGVNCTVYVTRDSLKCVDNYPCFVTLNDAVAEIRSNQVIELLDEKVELEGLLYLVQVKNLTVKSKVSSEISMSANSTDVNGPFLYIVDSPHIKIRGIVIKGVTLTDAPIILDRSELMVEDFKCENNILSAGEFYSPVFPAGCICARSARIRITNSTFRNNRVHAVNNGGNAHGGALSLIGGRLYIVDSNFSSNMAIADTAYGGAVYVKNGYLQAINVDFISNHLTCVSEGSGGAVFVSNGDLDLVSCRFINNTILAREPLATASGGAVYQMAKPIFPSPASYHTSIVLSTFHNNDVRGYGEFEGGAIAVAARSIILHRNNFTFNKIWSPHQVDQLAGRGSLTVRGGAAKIMAHDAVLLNNTFFNNTASASSGYTPGWAYGGAVELVTDRFAQLTIQSNIAVYNNIFEANSALGGKSTEDNTGGGAFGGGLRIVGLDTTISVAGNFFSQNTATGGDGPISGGVAEGGALAINHLSYLSISPSQISSNHNKQKKHNPSSHPNNYHLNHSIDTPYDPTSFKEIDQNLFFAQHQSHRPDELRVVVHNNSFTRNILFGGVGSMIGGDATGGAFYFEGAMLDLFGCSFNDNNANGGDTEYSAMGANTGGYAKGGAIYIHQHAAQVIVKGCFFELNRAQGGQGWNEPSRYSPSQYGKGGMAFGGAIAAWTILPEGHANHIHFQYCQFLNNHATGGSSYLDAGEGIGGAIWGSRLSITVCEFLANYAANGGAVYTIELISNLNYFMYNQARATSARDAVGGAIYTFNATVNQCEFEGNIAVTQFSEGNAIGGGIHSEERLTVTYSNFHTNFALTSFTMAKGGAIAASNQTMIKFCNFNNNTAASFDDGGVGTGGSLYLDISGEQMDSLLQNIQICFSVASYGGGIYMTGLNAKAVQWDAVVVTKNRATEAGGGVAFLPVDWQGKRIDSICTTCVIENNMAINYGDDLIGPYMSIIGNTSSTVNPGLPFEAIFTVLDYVGNTVKARGVGMTLTRSKDLLFQSGVWQNAQEMDLASGYIFFSAMTTWGAPNDQFLLNFTLTDYSPDFGVPNRIAISVSYQLDECPAGYRLDTSSNYITCQQCLAGLYGFQSNCKACPDDEYCARQNDSSTPNKYFIDAGFVPSPRTNPIAILQCPYIASYIDGQPQSSCLPSICITECGPDRELDSFISTPTNTSNNKSSKSTLLSSQHQTHSSSSSSSSSSSPHNKFSFPLTSALTNNKTKCSIQCGVQNICAPGHTGFLCSQCVCDHQHSNDDGQQQQHCWYPADDQCHKCEHNWRPTVIVFSVAISLFILLKGTLLVICMGILSIVVTFLLFFDLISTLIPSIFGTAFIIFAEAQRGSSSGLIKSFVFFMQTVSIFITPDVMPPQLSKLASWRVLTQFRVVGMECLSKNLFGNPFQRFIFSMLLPLALLLLVCAVYWLCELLRMIHFFRALQDFDPFEHIPCLRSRLQASRRANSEFSLLKDGIQSESEVPLASGEDYLSVGGGGGVDSSGLTSNGRTSSWMIADSDSLYSLGTLSWKQYVQFMNWKVGRVALFLIFAAHFELCNRILEAFAPCVNVPSEGFSYSSNYPWLICSTNSRSVTFFSPHSIHGKMAIAALLFGVVYIIGVPLGFGILLYWKRQEIKAGDSSTGQWLGLLYNSYRPSLHYFELAWLFRRILFAAAISVIPTPFVSHFLAPTVILFLSLLIQRRYKPFIAKSDNNMEVISLLTIQFTIITNAVITSRSWVMDAVVWRWLNFFVVLITMAAFLFKLFKPFLLFLRTPKED
jgi:hypothetical protein